MSVQTGTQKDIIQRAVHIMLFLGLLATVLYLGKSLLIPLFAAILFSFLVLPVVQKVTKYRFPNWLSSLIGVLVLLFSGILLCLFLSWQAASFIQDAPAMQKSVNQKKREVFNYLEKQYDIDNRKQKIWFEAKTDEIWNSASEHTMEIFSTTGAVVVTFLLIPIFMYFMLFYRHKFKKFLEFYDKKEPGRLIEIFRKISCVSQGYVSGMAIVILILTGLNTIGFLVIGLKYALLLGFIVAILNIIPYVGVLIGSLIPIAISLATKDSVVSAFAVLGVCVFTQFLENNFITPKIVGSSVNLNPLASIIALLIGGIIWGLPGMIMAIPIAGIFKVVSDNVEKLKPFGYLIGEEGDASFLHLKKLRRNKTPA